MLKIIQSIVVSVFALRDVGGGGGGGYSSRPLPLGKCSVVPGTTVLLTVEVTHFQMQTSSFFIIFTLTKQYPQMEGS